MAPLRAAGGAQAGRRAPKRLPANSRNSFATQRAFSVDGKSYTIYSLRALEASGAVDLGRLPYSIRVLLENLLRHEDGDTVTRGSIQRLAQWRPGIDGGETSFYPARVLMPDSSGVPLLVDLAAMRDALAAAGHDPALVNPSIPIDFVVDHSAVAEHSGTADARQKNLGIEFALHRERYSLIRWAQVAFSNIRVVPPGNGILHQINLEYLANVVTVAHGEEGDIAFPDSLVGMDSHTPMVNSLGVFGWGVGGIEAASAMLGEPISLPVPDVIGCRIFGRPRAGVTATDIVLTLVEKLRQHDIVGKFVEFCGPGLDALALPDRATIANMAPEYGATMGFFPTDDTTLRYLHLTGRSAKHIAFIERYAREQKLWREEEPTFTSVVDFDLGAVETVLAGPRRPQEKVTLSEVGASFRNAFGSAAVSGKDLRDGDVVIAAITSCTNTSNPTVMIGAGLLARNAVKRGLRARPWVKTSLSPGSRRVAEYLARAGLIEPLQTLGFHVVGFGCMTCVGNSGGLSEPIESQITDGNLNVAAVLSGNRNFEARVHALVRANYLASPPLVVAYALTGSVLIDLEHEPLGIDLDGVPVFLRDLWPADEEIAAIAADAVVADLFTEGYSKVEEGSPEWDRVPQFDLPTFNWREKSTYIRRPAYVAMPKANASADIIGARAIVMLGDGVTTDHITPVGATSADSQVGRYLAARGVKPADFNSLSSRRANPEVVARCTFANVRLRNEIAPGTEGDRTLHLPEGARMSIFEAAERYREEGVPLIAIAGANYGAGSSRDTAAKGVQMLGIRAVIAEGFERIHRSNLAGMGVLPFEFAPGTDRKTLGLTGLEVFDVIGLADGILPRAQAMLRIRYVDGSVRETALRLRIDTGREAAWCEAGGIMPYVLANLALRTT